MRAYVLDANALFALIETKPATLKVNALIKEALRGQCRVFMSSINYAEVYGLLLRHNAKDHAVQMMTAIGPLPIHVEEATTQRCFRAAEVKTTYKLYYADAFAAALAVEHKATLVTGDADFRRLGHGFPILWLKS